MSDHSDSDSSPKGSDSSGDYEKKHSSDESGSSDGVLVELPANPDQEEHNGILVNIDGSTQEAQDDTDTDAGREEMFEDATDEPETPGEILTTRGLDESMAVIEIGETSSGKDSEELARLKTRLEDSLAECKKYREEREVFGKEVASLRRQLLEMMDKESLNSISEETVALPTPLHAMLNDCSKFALHLKTITSAGPTDNLELQTIINEKQQEIEGLKLKSVESAVSRDVIFSYLGSMHDAWSETLKERLLPCFNTVLVQEEGALDGTGTGTDVLSLVESKTLLLVERQRLILSQIDQFTQYLAGFRLEFENLTPIDPTRVLGIALQELIETKKREADALDGMNNLEKKNEGVINQVEKLKASLDAANAETSKIKGELEQAENKYLATKEKLSMAVTKGKSLVQTRDSLKHSLAEKSSELDKCMAELKEKSDLLQASENLLEEKTSELEEKCDALQSSEVMIEELQKFVEERISELREKSSELQASEVKLEELQKLLEEKTSGLESCLHELKQKSDALEEMEKLLEEKKSELEEKKSELNTSEVSLKEVEKLLEEKTSELVIELQGKSNELQSNEIRLKELEKFLEEKITELEKCFVELEASEGKVKEVENLLEEKANELEQCKLELQEKSELLEEKATELKKCKLELQEKSGELQASQISEVTVEELQKVLEEKRSKLERFNLDLQQKSDVLQATELTVKELQISLEEKTNELERSSLNLQACEDSLKELKMVLKEKTNELEKSMNESKERLIELEIVKASSSELSETQSTIASLQVCLSQKENVLNQIETVLSDFHFPDELGLLEPVQKVRWLVEQKGLSDVICLEHGKIRETLDLVDLPVPVSSSGLDSQINWLVDSLKKAREDLVKMEDENSNLEAKLSNLSEEIDGLNNSLLEVKQEKDVVRNELAEILAKYQKAGEELSLVSSQKDELIKALEESFQITMDRENPNSSESVIEKFVHGIQERAKSSFDDHENFEKLQGLLYERDQELILCKKLLEDSVNKSEVERLAEELGKFSEEEVNLKKEKEILQKELERVEEKNALVREKLSMAVKKGKGLVQEREGFKQALDEKSSEIEKLKKEVQSKDSIIQNLKEQIERLSSQLTHVNALETEIDSLKQTLDQTMDSLRELVDSLENISVPTGTSFEGPIEKMNWVKKQIEESEISRVKTEKELADEISKNQTLEKELSNAKEIISSISKEKEEILHKKTGSEQELEKIKLEFSTSTGKLTDAFVKIKTLEDALSQAKKDISLLDNMKSEIEMRNEKEVSELNARINECMAELKESRTSLENHLSEKSREFEKFKEVLKDESLLYFVKDEFRKKINSLRGMGLLMHEMHQQFNAKGYSIDPSIKVSGFAKFLSLPSYDKFINERKSRNKTEDRNFSEGKSIKSLSKGLNEQTNYITNYFKDLSNYMDDHITLMSQALQATSEEFFHMMDSEDTLKFDLQKLEDHNKVQEEKLKTLTSDMNELRAKLEKAESGSQTAFEDRDLHEERISTLEKDNLCLQAVCDTLKSKIESYEAREEELVLLQESLTKGRGISGLIFSEQEVAALIDKVNQLDVSFIESEPSENSNLTNPLGKISYILDQFIELHQKMADLNYEKEDLQLAFASNSTEYQNLKGEYETICTNLEKLVQKLVQLGGGKDNLQDQKLSSSMELLSFLERVVVSLIVEYDNSKSKLMEMEGKLKTREKMVNELNGRVKMLEDSHQFLVSQSEMVKERGLVEASSSARNSDTSEIEDLGPLGKSTLTTAARSTRKVSSDHLVLNIGTETERLVSVQETEDKGHVFKSLNTSGLIPVQGKFIADKVDSIWVSGSRVLMSQPRARLGLVAYCLFLHLWFLGSIVF